MHDPVSPILIHPAVIGWEGKNRRVDLTIERSFKGEELLLRMKGWVTVEPREVVATVKPEGFIKVHHQGELIVEADSWEQIEQIRKRIADRFGEKVSLDPMPE
jgi:hypothetical protein